MILNMEYYRKKSDPGVVVPYVYFIDLRAGVTGNQICTGYTKNGSEVTFPLTNQTVSDPEHIDYRELGLTPIITTSTSVLKTCRYAETGSSVTLTCRRPDTSTTTYDTMFGSGSITNTTKAQYPASSTFNDTLIELVIHGTIERGGAFGCVSLTHLDISESAHLSFGSSDTASYAGIFASCTSLVYVRARETTSEKDDAGCTNCIFSLCSSLVTIEGLTLNHDPTGVSASGGTCYFGGYMFVECDSLIDASQINLPLRTLPEYCYYQMFYRCDNLRTPPVLPATTIANYCYYQMFYECDSLTTAPYLPATTLANSCYYDMFYGCDSLTTAPYLPATTLASKCYNTMFSYCHNLSSIRIGYTGVLPAANDATTSWLTDVSSTGTFYYNGSSTTRSSSAIPEGWTIRRF